MLIENINQLQLCLHLNAIFAVVIVAIHLVQGQDHFTHRMESRNDGAAYSTL